ncbi:MAG: porin family protein [Myxacorys chilensis ATA2-1-KO14]|nr:porin family protein [Myxacorys chilensis ATA2-1-KO14]
MRSLQSVAMLSGLAALVVSPLFVGVDAASAQPAPRYDRSYVGAGISGGVLSGGRGNDGTSFGGNVQGRFAIPNTPVSARGSVLFTGKNSAIIPTLTYDVRLNDKSNLYAGAGYSFVQNGGVTSPIGNQDAAVLTAGVESQVAKGIVVYSDAKYGINAFRGSDAGALSLQAGVGLEF